MYSSTSNTYDALHRQPWTKLVGTLRLFFYQSSHAYVISPLHQSMLTAMRFSLLLSLASETFTSTLIGGEGGQMMKLVFLYVHFDIEED